MTETAESTADAKNTLKEQVLYPHAILEEATKAGPIRKKNAARTLRDMRRKIRSA